MASREEIFDRSRFSKAIFWGAFGAVLTMYKRHQIDTQTAFDYLVDLYTQELQYTKPAERILSQLTLAIINEEMDDLPPV